LVKFLRQGKSTMGSDFQFVNYEFWIRSVALEVRYTGGFTRMHATSRPLAFLLLQVPHHRLRRLPLLCRRMRIIMCDFFCCLRFCTSIFLLYLHEDQFFQVKILDTFIIFSYLNNNLWSRWRELFTCSCQINFRLTSGFSYNTFSLLSQTQKNHIIS